MLNFFEMIAEYFQILFGMIGNMITSLLQAVGYATTAASTATMALSFMPAFISGCGIVVITLAVIKFLLGR